MANERTSEMMRPLPIALAVLALVGWALAGYAFWQRGEVEDRLTAELQAERSAHQATGVELAGLGEAAGSREELETIVEALRAEREQLATERDAVAAELEEARTTRAGVEEELAARSAELEAVQTELAPLTEQLGSFDERLAAAEQAIVERTRELAEVGERLEAARAQEAEIQATLARLTEEAAHTSQTTADAEHRLQQARQAEAELETELAAAREIFEQIEREQAGLEAHVNTLTERRDALLTDTEAARQHRDTMQAAVSELTDMLATRANDLQDLEARLVALQEQDAAIDQAAAAGLLPGRYVMGPIVASFGSDGRFEMANVQFGQEASGTYAVEDGRLTLQDVEGDTGVAQFPITCAIAPEATGFSLHDEDGSCALFSGQLFERAG